MSFPIEIILNVGLDGVPVNGESYTNGVRNPHRVEQLMAVVQATRQAGFAIIEAKLLQSDTEPTAVMRVTRAHSDLSHTRDAVFRLAQALNQEAIAAYSAGHGQGWLLGPGAHNWGDFNPAFFIMPDGKRLAQPAVYEGHLADGSGIQKHSAGGAYPYVLVLRDSQRPGEKFDWGLVGGRIERPIWLASGASWNRAVDELKATGVTCEIALS